MKMNTNTDEHMKNERENVIKKHLRCKFIRINPNKKDFEYFADIGKIHDHIKKSSIDERCQLFR